MTAHSEVLYNAKMRLNEDANRYRMAHETLQELRRHLGELTVQQRTDLPIKLLQGLEIIAENSMLYGNT